MDILGQLRSDKKPSLQKFSIYIPDKDKNRNSITPDQEAWIEAALHLLSDINGGATRMPDARGCWKGQSGEYLDDNVAIVYSFITDPDEFEEKFSLISAFVHHFGSQAKQESVILELTDGHRAYFLYEKDYIV